MLNTYFIMMWAMFYCLLFSYPCLSQDLTSSPSSQNSYSLGLARNFPVRWAADHYSAGDLQPIIGYQYFMGRGWLLGVSGQFKMFYSTDLEQSQNFLTLAQESMYEFRLYHPIYLLVGGKLLYILPVEKVHIPIVKSRTIDTEIGVAAALAGMVKMSEKRAVSLQWNRWRGVRTNKLHGVEFSIQYHVVL